MNISMNVIGWIATILAIVMYAPQSWKVLKHKKADGISKPTFLLVSFGTIVWIIAAPLGNSWQGWSANVVISILMISILYFVFKDKKIIFWAIVATIVAVIAVSIFFWTDRNIDTPVWVSILFVTLAGIFLSSALAPQAYKVIKEKKIGEFSLLSTLLVIINNILWTTYWLMKAITDSNDDLAYNIIALIGSALPLIMPSLILIINYKNNRKITQ